MLADLWSGAIDAHNPDAQTQEWVNQTISNSGNDAYDDIYDTFGVQHLRDWTAGVNLDADILPRNTISCHRQISQRCGCSGMTISSGQVPQSLTLRKIQLCWKMHWQMIAQNRGL
ncbi:hypothetical protein [Alloscardovia venturai]|uniref:hypothetical protein n=1 Tax=Alloscardovia venturai TaxID=1769421 RepID=UPI00366FFF72